MKRMATLNIRSDVIKNSVFLQISPKYSITKGVKCQSKYEKKNKLYDELRIEQRLLRQSEKTGFINLSEKENGNPETGIRVEGCV